MPSVEFEPTVSAGERPHTYALDRAATGTGNYNYIHETKHVFKVYSVADVLWLQFVVLRVMIFTIIIISSIIIIITAVMYIWVNSS